ncbi:hypothetical protein SLA2020_116300 [Shorea laevis]
MSDKILNGEQEEGASSALFSHKESSAPDWLISEANDSLRQNNADDDSSPCGKTTLTLLLSLAPHSTSPDLCCLFQMKSITKVNIARNILPRQGNRFFLSLTRRK